MIHIVIFSRNRACQLHALLRSIKDHLTLPWGEISVLYRFDGGDFRKGYERLQETKVIEPVSWVRESSFRKDLMDILVRSDRYPFLMFLVDDDIVFKPADDTSILEAFSAEHLFVSTRCSVQYAKGVLPGFLKSNPYREWFWNYDPDQYTGWNYPFSLDGNIYDRGHLLGLLSRVRFKAPNSLERVLHENRFDPHVLSRPKALATREAVVFSNPLNKVQTEWETWHGNVSARECNNRFLRGFVMDPRPFYDARPGDYHHLVHPVWVRE
jgi:hypothetical protein